MTLPHDLVLFDLDGTLSDPSVGIGRSINHALTRFGHPPITAQRVAACIGPPLDEIFRCLTGSAAQTDVDALVQAYRECYADTGHAENTLYPGIPRALAVLADAGMPMGICTSKRADFAERILQTFGLREHFRFVSGGDVGVAKTQQIAMLLDEGRVSASTVMVGDRAVDMQAAHRNGLSAAGVRWGFGTEAELDVEAPRYLFDAPAQLAKLAGLAAG